MSNVKNSSNNRPRPIFVKCEPQKQKIKVQQQGRQLKEKDFGLNDQFPKEIMQRRKQLYSFRKQMKEGQISALSGQAVSRLSIV